MSILSESLTIGLLLALVFGALFFYLYSRVAYSEKRVGLIENILIDIKMNQEQQPVHVLPSIPPSMNFNNVSFIPPSQHSIEFQEMPNTPRQQQQQQQQQQEEQLQEYQELTTNEESSQPNNDEMYSGILDEVHASLDLSENNVIHLDETHTSAKVSVNYESMTKEELVEVARQKGIRLSNRPGREKLLQLIRGSELMAIPEQ